MVLTEEIQEHVQKLPASVQAEVLDFVQFLLVKSGQQREEDDSTLSLTLAMQGMEDEPDVYGLNDLKEKFA